MVKDGVKRQKQNYLCRICSKQFIKRQRIDNQRIADDYVFGKQTYSQLAKKYGLSVSTIRRRIDLAVPKRIISAEKRVVVLMDATYWGWSFGVVAMKDSRTKKILWRKFIKRKETVADYTQGIDWLEEQGFLIDGVVSDGLRGLSKKLERYPFQMCQFHQVKSVVKYLTNKPKPQASIELLALVKLICHTDRESFEGTFWEWTERWAEFLNERATDPTTGKSRYVHRKLRSVYLSLKRNMPLLWTWYDRIELGIPNTNNALEGKFTDLKTKLRNHNGLSKERRKKFIDHYFKVTFD